MYSMSNMELWTAWLFVYIGMPLAWFSVVLHLKTPWVRTAIGRHLMSYALVIAAIMTFTAIRWWHREEPLPHWFDNLRLITYMLLIAVMAWRVAIQANSLRRPTRSQGRHSKKGSPE